MEKSNLINQIANNKISGSAKRCNRNITVNIPKLKKRAAALGFALILGTSLANTIFSEEISLLKSGVELKTMINDAYKEDGEIKDLVDDLDRCKNQTLGNFTIGNPFNTSSILCFGIPPCEENCSACISNSHKFEEIEKKLRENNPKIASAIEFHETLSQKTEGKNM